MNNEEQKRINFVLRGAIVGGTAGAGVIAAQAPSQAIAISDVNTAMTSIVTNAGGVADVAFPIGAAAVALTIIAMILRKFIMV